MQALSSRATTRPVGMLKVVLLVAAFASFLLSVCLYFIAEDTSAGIFVGIWVPSILSLGALLLAGERRPV
jgi:hypothetical protein